MSDWDSMPGELKERRPVAEQVYHEVRAYKTVEQVTEELQFAVSELSDWHEEAVNMQNQIEATQLLVHALQLRLIELRYQGER